MSQGRTGSGADGVPLRQVLGRLPLFSQLPGEQLDLVGGATRVRRLGAGEVLFHAGEECTAFFCVVAGQLKLTLSTSGGDEKVLEIISAGETFGEAVMFAGRPYPVTATALLRSVLAAGAPTFPYLYGLFGQASAGPGADDQLPALLHTRQLVLISRLLRLPHQHWGS